ncbi:unnamed protein product [Trichobilharzia regenti]|nr:unnamed protein product [Trichobilharzia regenti]
MPGGDRTLDQCVETRLASSDETTGNLATPGVPEATPVIPGGGGVGWNWEVVVGGTHLLTPKVFLDNLENMAKIIMPPVTTAPIPESILRRVSLQPPHRG